MTTTQTEAAQASPSPRASQSHEITEWDLVVAMLHYRSVFVHLVTPRERVEALLLCDGFGDIAQADPRHRADMLADWSHVRDSSPEAIARCADYLIRKLAEKGKVLVVINGMKAARATVQHVLGGGQ